ncbi:MAG: PLP-dependent aminotransferase family protein [Proteobacteria bacterium]|nr:PLP-dependent aminotransferase family protein [Burkholderiales bacterium]
MNAPGMLYAQVADVLAQSIRTGTLRRGERLMSVRDAARRHGVSVATAIQAYRSLEDAQMIEARPRSGFYVAARATRLPEPKATRPPERPRTVELHAIAAQVKRLAYDPDFVSFGSACPGNDLFDNDRVRRVVNRTIQRSRSLLTHYPFGPGQECLRRAIARYALGLGCVLSADQIVITSGCIDAISLALRAVTQPGDIVALESPAYFSFLEILQTLQLKALEIPTHPRTGLSLNALQLALDTQPVRALLTVPTLSNPMGACMPQAERRRLAGMAAAHDIALIEDVVYNELAVQDDKRRAIQSFDDTGHVMLCGSFTKTIAPGIRLGWMHGGRWHDKVARLQAVTSGTNTPVMETALAELISQTGQEAAYRQLRTAIASRVDQARSLIAASFPKGTRVTDPPGGYILWVELPPTVDGLEVYEACIAERICVAPGSLFSTSKRYSHCLRLSVGLRWTNLERQALCRIGEIATTMAERAEQPAGTRNSDVEPLRERVLSR